MNRSAPFVRRPIATSLLAAAVLLAGSAAFLRLPPAPLGPGVPLRRVAVNPIEHASEEMNERRFGSHCR